MEALSDPDPTVRISAIDALATEPHEIVTAELLKRFRDNDPNVRLAAADVLARRVDTPPAHFVPLLHDANFEVRLAAVQYLGGFRIRRSLLNFCPCSTMPTATYARRSRAPSEHARCEGAVETLVIMLADEEQMVRVAAEVA
jgi:hypothetical protein